MTIATDVHRRPRVAAVVAAAVYLVLVLITVRPLLPAPATTLLFPSGLGTAMDEAFWIDQQLALSRIAEVAHRLATRPWAIGESGLCHPMPRAYTLGEHMFAEGLLALLPHVLTRDPILTYNVVRVLSLWIAACAMYALVYYWTRHAVAAFVAGCFFAFYPVKTGDAVHPFVHANHWTVLALLFAHRLFARRQWRDAAGLAASVGLQLLESFYAVVGLAIIGAVYGGHLAVHYRRRLPALAPKLLACAAVVLVVALGVFAPYLHTRRNWGVLGGRQTGLFRPRDFGPGGRAFPGWLPAALAGVALLDRARRRRSGLTDDPRLPMLAAGVIVGWVAMAPVAVPGTRVRIPAPVEVLRGIVPGLDAVRAAFSIGDGVQLVIAFLAGLGAARLLAACPHGARALGTTALVGVTLAEIVVPGSTGAFPAHRVLPTWVVHTPEDLRDLTARLPAGAVLDLPYVPAKANSRLRAHYLLLSAFHLQPTAACHYSFSNPLGGEVDALVRRLPDVRAADALHALGFRTVVVHHEEPSAAAAGQALEALQRLGRAREVARAVGHTAYSLETPLEVRTGLDVLTPAPSPDVIWPPGQVSQLGFGFLNPSPAIYRHPDPLEPTTCLIRWYAGSGALVATQEQRLLLPLALGAGDQVTRHLAVRPPVAAGAYEVTLAAAEAPDTILSRVHVRVDSLPATTNR